MKIIFLAFVTHFYQAYYYYHYYYSYLFLSALHISLFKLIVVECSLLHIWYQKLFQYVFFFKLPPLHLKFRVIILRKSSILSSCFPSFCEARHIRLLHFSCNLAAVTIVLAISPFLLLTFHVLSTLRVLVTKSVRISYKTESINFLCLVMMGTDDVCHQQKINDRRTVDACGSLFFPLFLFFFPFFFFVLLLLLYIQCTSRRSASTSGGWCW